MKWYFLIVEVGSCLLLEPYNFPYNQNKEMRFEPAGFLLSYDASILQEDVKANRGWNVCCHLEAKILWFWEKRSNKWNTRGQILFKNVSTFNLRRRKEGILLCGTWSCLNGNKLPYKISTNSYIQWLFDMDLPSYMASRDSPTSAEAHFNQTPEREVKR